MGSSTFARKPVEFAEPLFWLLGSVMLINYPVVMQLAGVVLFGFTIWKGAHGLMPTTGLTAGAGLAYVGKHFAGLLK